MDFGLIVDGFVDTFSVRVRNLLNLQNHFVYIEFECFYPSEIMDFCDFHDLFRYMFWHRFLMSLGIDFNSILEAFWP